ncbi:PREDICTED: dyslexia susceptibility 1 candidate gene 1 protein homolog [Wasmannia auropunctata]|uniref:dyslexia susceptibility 1 candidate gene 1 protein homolog n=1 Tax=Wasmannia auropunctata TaxID=64793 RepID=UPI0005ED9369|nr:PREDICTED: dyslexia susceptibility 1 candidate gene 1 protein homolog [Wasmannia auropunctata]
MAIVIKDYQWRQTDKRIIIHVPLRGRPKNVDLFVMDNYVKISFSPFILELFLWENVLEEESECTLTDTEAIFSLQKANVAIDWPSLEAENINKSEKCHTRNRILEKAQSVLENRAKLKKEKLQNLQKEAVKIQINVDTNILNKIEHLKDCHRKAAMQDLEEWRSNAEMPFLQDIPGKVQKNRKAYRPPLQWFEDNLDIIKSRELDEKEIEIEEKQESIVIEELKEELIVNENSEKDSTEGNMKEELIIKEDIKKDLIVKENTNESLSIEKDLKAKSNIEEHSEKVSIIEHHPRIESIDRTNLKEGTILNENIGKKVNVEIRKTTRNPSGDFNFDECSSCSEDSESDDEITASKSSTKPLVKEMNQKSLKKFYKKTEKQRPGQELIDRILKGRYPKINQIFDEPTKAVPLPRRGGTINVTFSERAFPTPARESAFIEEQEWLSKQAEARRKTGFVVEDLRPEEQDPQWLKDKGDEFFKAGNYLAAISAYTHGIKISDKLAALYVNRSAAHFALGNYYRCIDDCSKVLELMEPKCESNRVSRAKCHARRGAALCKLSAPQHGIPELEAALKLDPNNKSIKHDLYAVRQYFNIQE